MIYLKNIKLTLTFDGSAYHGWQRQKNAITVQETVENALAKAIGHNVMLVGCSRTDAGVHAREFVCNFSSDTQIPSERLPFALNTYLPKDIVCLSAADVPQNFNAITSALGKRYTYYIYNSQFPDIFSHSWHCRHTLDTDAMQNAARAFLGTHDFLGFAAAGFTVKSTIRTIHSLNIEKKDSMISIDVSGDGFLYNMVRIIAGTLFFVGSGKILPKDMPDIIASRDRTRAGITAPADGLFLSEVYYEKEI